MIAILDYGAGNLRSVENTLAEIGADYTLVRDAAGLRRASKIILPGVGHFGQMLRALDAHGRARGAGANASRAGVPFLGICLGLQALFESSEEAPGAARPGPVPGRGAPLPRRRARAAHGLERARAARPDRDCCAGSAPQPYVYFAHSYYVPVVDATAATCTYALPYTAALEAGQCLRRAVSSREIRAAWDCKIVRNFVEL